MPAPASGREEPRTSDGQARVRVLLVDDHALFRMGLKRALHEFGVAVIGEASNGRDAVRLATELRPDVVVLDVDLPGHTGIEAAAAIAAVPGGPRVLALSSTRSDRVLDVLLAGASGILVRDADAADLARGIAQAAQGGCALAPCAANGVVDRLRELESAQRAIVRRIAPTALTERERQVLQLIAAGHDNSAIGRLLHISASTVKHHVAAILDKLGAANRAQAAAEAVRIGIA